jgi:hypothetical protein
MDCAAQFYAGRFTTPVFRYLAERGFPEPFVHQRRIGYAPVSSSSRDLLVRHIRGAAKSNGTRLLTEAIEAGLVVQDKVGVVRDFFASETSGYIMFPNVVHGRVVISRPACILSPLAVAPISTCLARPAICTMLGIRGSARDLVQGFMYR